MAKLCPLVQLLHLEAVAHHHGAHVGVVGVVGVGGVHDEVGDHLSADLTARILRA